MAVCKQGEITDDRSQNLYRDTGEDKQEIICFKMSGDQVSLPCCSPNVKPHAVGQIHYCLSAELHGPFLQVRTIS